jgi:DNA excision repair protein ERCC-5
MEAEAQCATLNRNNLCDGSITEDSDIILFGAKKVYKNVFNQKFDAEVYQEDDVKCILGRVSVLIFKPFLASFLGLLN